MEERTNSIQDEHTHPLGHSVLAAAQCHRIPHPTGALQVEPGPPAAPGGEGVGLLPLPYRCSLPVLSASSYVILRRLGRVLEGTLLYLMSPLGESSDLKYHPYVGGSHTSRDS